MNPIIPRAVAGAIVLILCSVAAHSNGEPLAARFYGEGIDQATVNAFADGGSRAAALARIVEQRRTEYLMTEFRIARDTAAMTQYLQKRYPALFSDSTASLETEKYVALRDGLSAVLAGKRSIDDTYAQVKHVVPTLEEWRKLAGDSNADYLASLDRLIQRSDAERDAELLILLKPNYESERIRDAICEQEEIRVELDAKAARLEKTRLPNEPNFEKRRHDVVLGHCWIAAAGWLREHTRDNLTIVDDSLLPANEILYSIDPVEEVFRRSLD